MGPPWPDPNGFPLGSTYLSLKKRERAQHLQAFEVLLLRDVPVIQVHGRLVLASTSKLPSVQQRLRLVVQVDVQQAIRLHLGHASQLRHIVVEVEASTLNNHVAIDGRAIDELHTHTVGSEASDLTNLQLEHAVVAGDKGHIRDRDRMVVRLQQALIPTLGRSQSCILVAILPALEGYHVARLVSHQLLVQRPQKRQHVDPLRACRPVPPAQQRHVPGAVLHGGPDVLERKGSGADHKHRLAPISDLLHRIAVAIKYITTEKV
mmetsp:Transcript_93413/g.302425  ORF Transcript_93413/g.302425 Transcript_93413/m.302425 type:complete len:263 (+) Transcript_93413:254-1042(+)